MSAIFPCVKCGMSRRNTVHLNKDQYGFHTFEQRDETSLRELADIKEGLLIADVQHIEDGHYSRPREIIAPEKTYSQAEFNAGVAGAYAATAKHYPIFHSDGSRNGYFTCHECSWDSRQGHVIGWESHILALTPADARQAQTQHDEEIRDAAERNVRSAVELALTGDPQFKLDWLNPNAIYENDRPRGNSK